MSGIGRYVSVAFSGIYDWNIMKYVYNLHIKKTVANYVN